MITVSEPIHVSELKEIAKKQFGNLVKAVVDVDRQVMVVGGEFHADEEAELLLKGSSQADLWGINLYPEKFNTVDFIEYDSMINLRPSQQNLSRGIDSEEVRGKIIKIVEKLVLA